jgi:two-component system, sensor histidine kinase LadS
LPNTPTPGAAHIAETIRRQIEELDFTVGHEHVPLTASLGLATAVPSANITAQALLKTAEQLLYQAKQSGRNRCAMLPQALGYLGPASAPRKAAATPVTQP